MEPSLTWYRLLAIKYANFAGIQASEIHLCGEASSIPLIRKLLESTKDVIEVNEYNRLSSLEVEEKPIKNFKNVQKGDCVVGFSRKTMFILKQEIEKATRLKCAMVYGGLPPEVRAEQARLFNQGEVYDILVASDAVGMGLNL